MIRLTGDNVLLRMDPIEISEGGIVLVRSMKPKDRQKAYTKGTVVDVGPGTRDYAVDVRPGDRVLAPELCGDIVRAGVDAALRHFPEGTERGTEFRIARESEIIGVLV